MRPWADRPTDRLIRPQRTGKVISARGGADDRIAGCTIGVQNNKNYGCPRRALTPRYIAGAMESLAVKPRKGHGRVAGGVSPRTAGRVR